MSSHYPCRSCGRTALLTNGLCGSCGGPVDLSDYGFLDEPRRSERTPKTKVAQGRAALDSPAVVNEALLSVLKATGLDRDHPYVIAQVSRLTNWTPELVRMRVTPSQPIAERLVTLEAIAAAEVDRDALWLVEGVIPRGVVTTFAGKSKAGKSRLALEAARALSGCGDFLDEYTAARTDVLFVCGDDSDNALYALFQDWQSRWGVPEGVSVVMNPELDLLGPTGMREVRGLLEGYTSPPLLVVDSLYNFTPTLDDNERGPVKKVMGDLAGLAKDGLAAGVLIVDHTAKTGRADAGADAVLGSQAKGGMSRSGVNVEVIGERQRDDGETVLLTRLVRWGNSGRGWSVVYAHHAPSFTWVKQEDSETAEGDDLCLRAAVLLREAGGSMPLKQLGQALDYPATNLVDNPVRLALAARPDQFVLDQPDGARRPWVVTLLDTPPI